MSLSNGGLSKGGLSNGLAASANERPEADGEPSAYAPRWARDAYDTPRGESFGAPRKVVPLRMPAAPQLAPADAPASARPPRLAPASAPTPASAHPAKRRPTGPELLAEDEVLKRLLQRHGPDPKPLVSKPTRDPVGFALGMVARLIVAGCAAAVAALLLLGVNPLSFRLGTPVANETTASMTSSVPETMTLAAAPQDAAPRPATPATTVAVRAAEPAAAQAAPVPAAGSADRWALDAGEIDRLVKRGNDYLAQGDIAAARLILGRAAAARDPRAALSLGATYDPAVLRDLHVVGFRPDVPQARAWYDKAVGYGSRDAAARLAALPSADH